MLTAGLAPQRTLLSTELPGSRGAHWSATIDTLHSLLDCIHTCLSMHHIGTHYKLVVARGIQGRIRGSLFN